LSKFLNTIGHSFQLKYAPGQGTPQKGMRVGCGELPY
jgi:hypothetical protein